LENYLSRSASFTELLQDDLSQPRNSRRVVPHDNMRFILNSGKFVGRALMRWGRERELDTLLRNAKTFAAELHKADPDIVFLEVNTTGLQSTPSATVTAPVAIPRDRPTSGASFPPFIPCR
jgi:hypothetical protein